MNLTNIWCLPIIVDYFFNEDKPRTPSLLQKQTFIVCLKNFKFKTINKTLNKEIPPSFQNPNAIEFIWILRNIFPENIKTNNIYPLSPSKSFANSTRKFLQTFAEYFTYEIDATICCVGIILNKNEICPICKNEYLPFQVLSQRNPYIK